MSFPSVALVTGGSRGIGRAISIALGEAGFSVAVNYASNAKAAEEVAAQISAGGTEAIPLKGDVASTSDRLAMVRQTLDRFGRIDLLVNNAGISSPGRRDILDATEESWDEVFRVNLKGPFFLSQAVAREMISLVDAGTIPGGKIVTISSISAFAASSNRADYCIAKAGLPMMTWLFAARLAEFNIQTFDVCPGVIETDMTSGVREKYDELIASGAWPMRRWGKPDEVARAVVAIALDTFPFSTGEQIHVDGGFHVRRL
jgi:NAD(P)-dependent dehydrogenase (short-subunit alcohol dehydrogenase family)